MAGEMTCHHPLANHPLVIRYETAQRECSKIAGKNAGYLSMDQKLAMMFFILDIENPYSVWPSDMLNRCLATLRDNPRRTTIYGLGNAEFHVLDDQDRVTSNPYGFTSIHFIHVPVKIRRWDCSERCGGYVWWDGEVNNDDLTMLALALP